MYTAKLHRDENPPGRESTDVFSPPESIEQAECIFDLYHFEEKDLNLTLEIETDFSFFLLLTDLKFSEFTSTRILFPQSRKC